jgi:hypothetical protein
MYECSCGKQYVRLKPFQTHRAVCELMRLSKNSKQDITHITEMPSQIDMWLALKSALVQIDQLKTKVEKQDRWIKRQKKKIPVIDWLNENCKPDLSFNQWEEEISLNEKDLKLIFNHDFINGMYYIMQKRLDLAHEASLPIRAFEQKLNVLFVYTGNKWEMLDCDKMALLIDKFHKKIHKLFVKWSEAKQKRMDYSDIDETYYKNLAKVMGGTTTREVSTKKISFKLYNHLKFNLKNIVQYEFTF